MLKFIGRFLVILAVSVLIAGGMYALVQQDPSALGLSNQVRGPEGQLSQNRQFQGLPAGGDSTNSGVIQSGQGTGFREREHDFEGRGGSGMGFLGILKNLAVFALITLAVVGLQKLISLLKGRLTVKSAPIGG
jgi:hypothetical protein